MRRAINAPTARADGNLSYSEFVYVVKQLWNKYHPDIPMVPEQGRNRAKYPSIYYRLESRRPVENEAKPRVRPFVDGHDDIIITAQRFLNIVGFTAVTQTEPEEAEAIIDEFENFMLDMVPVLKRMGVQEIFYNRRFPENDENREGQDICKRSVAYNVTTEKVRTVKVSRLDNFLIDARIYADTFAQATPSELATPTSIIVDTFHNATPSH